MPESAQLPSAILDFVENRLHKILRRANLKAFLLGTYHGRCTNLQAYLDENCFRFNRRMTGNQIFLRLTRAVATSCGMLS